MANVGNNVVQLGGTASNALFRGTKADDLSQATTGFAQLVNKNSEQLVAKLDHIKKIMMLMVLLIFLQTLA